MYILYEIKNTLNLVNHRLKNKLIWKQLVRILNKTVKTQACYWFFQTDFYNLAPFLQVHSSVIDLLAWWNIASNRVFELHKFMHQWFLQALVFIDCIHIVGGSVKRTFTLFWLYYESIYHFKILFLLFKIFPYLLFCQNLLKIFYFLPSPLCLTSYLNKPHLCLFRGNLLYLSCHQP